MIATTVTWSQLRLRSEAPARPFVNPRTLTSSGLDHESLRELALTIGRNGLLTRLIVSADVSAKPGSRGEVSVSYLIVAGQRRFCAIGLLLDWRTWLADDLLAGEAEIFDRRADQFRSAVPVELSDDSDLDAVALVDNLHRRDLSSYETARALAQMDDTGASLARRVGRSPSWVSRHLTCWRQAGPQLAAAWHLGLAFERVLELAPLSHDEQAAALAAAPRGVRGPVNRPGIDAVKARLAELEAIADPTLVTQGALAALRWVATGAPTPGLSWTASPTPNSQEP